MNTTRPAPMVPRSSGWADFSVAVAAEASNDEVDEVDAVDGDDEEVGSAAGCAAACGAGSGVGSDPGVVSDIGCSPPVVARGRDRSAAASTPGAV